MPKVTIKYVCQECGAIQAKWIGKCPSCGGWNTLIEEMEVPPAAKGSVHAMVDSMAEPASLGELVASQVARQATGVAEFDRVLGGGLVPGSLVLIGGEPGIGKSTLLLQACQGYAKAGRKVLYVSGEESLQQISLRAKRLGISDKGILLLAETRLEAVVAAVDKAAPDLLILDSIQTMLTIEVPATAGSLTQVRECTLRLMGLAKGRNLAVFMIGHVTKDGGLAGPKALEHLVDTVLSFEGEKHHPFRVLRASKNRFGSTQESGLFEMAEQGLLGVDNPSAYLCADQAGKRDGSAVLACLEGSRPMLVEVQALVTPTHYGTPQRSSTGPDPWRLSLIYAVLEKRCGILLYNQDIFVSVAGGMAIQEPAADLALACAVASSHRAQPLPSGWVIFGEIGLGGELRPVQQTGLRLKEAKRMGYKQALIPKADAKEMARLAECGLVLHAVPELGQALGLLWD